MKKFTIASLSIFTAMCMLTPAFIKAQSTTVNIGGTVVDSIGQALPGATTVLMTLPDSVISSFVFSDKEGAFNLKGIKPGNYLLQITYVGYLNYYKSLTIRSDVLLDPLVMLSKNSSINEVVIEGERTPIILKKDTIEYNAEAFKVQPNATVEDLLKRLPGVEVESDGTVKAQGETVERVLVDGKEFFGTDPKMATKNLPADAIDKVQVFDRLSDMAQFTGIDDGDREKTINLELKEDSKQGYFGTVTGGYGTDDRYNGKASINKFTKKTQLSFLGMANNINQQGFTFEDYVGFLGGVSNLRRGGRGGGGFSGGNNTGVNINEDLSNGFVKTSAGGLNLNHTFNKNTKLNISYFLNSVRRDIDKDITRQNFLESGTFSYDEVSNSFNENLNHRINMRFEHKIDSTQELILTANAGLTDGESESISNSTTRNVEGVIENEGDNDLSTNAERYNFSSNLTYRKRLNDEGRNLVTSVSISGNDNDRDNEISTFNRFFEGTTLSRIDSTVQNQFQNNKQFSYNLRLSYTEPLGDRKYLEFNASHRAFENEVDRGVFDIVGQNGNLVEVANDQLSNAYESDYIYQQGGLNFRLVRNKLNFSTGLSAQRSHLDGEIFAINGNPNVNTSIDNDFFFLLPSMQLRLNFASSRNLFIQYRTNVNEPSIEQLQPIVDNSDPLNIYVGNPELRPEYTHRLTSRFLSFSQFTFTSFFAYVDISYTDNSIVNATSVDSLFRVTTTPVNVDNAYRILNFASFSTPIRKLGIDIRLNYNVTYNRGIQFINLEETDFDRIATGGGVRIDNRKKDVIDIAVGGNLNHSLTTYSNPESPDQSFFNQRYFGELNINLGQKWRIGSEINYTIYQGDAFGEAEKIPIWEASLSRYIFEGNRGEIQLTAFDLLNKNRGINQTSDLNYIEEERITSLGRYVMLSFTYNLSRLGANPAALPPGRRQFFRPR